MTKTKNSKLKRIILIPLYVAIIFFLLFAVSLQIFFPSKMLKVFGFQFFLISYTGSMEPMLNYNDLILVKKYDFDDLKVGDIITFDAQTTDGGNMIITHKIEQIYSDRDGVKYLVTKGINKSERDYIPVTKDGIYETNVYLGKYSTKSEFAGNFVAYLQSSVGFFALSVNVICIICIYSIAHKMQNPTLERISLGKDSHSDNSRFLN